VLGFQRAHTDLLGILLWKDVLIAGVNVACSAILAVEDNTFVYVYDSKDALKEREKVHIPKGCLFLFSGDLIHAGMNSPTGDNIRIHIILKTREFLAGGNEQGWLKTPKKNGKWEYLKGCTHTALNNLL
jgi:hypothetical protein